jgi:hypothetical protein
MIEQVCYWYHGSYFYKGIAGEGNRSGNTLWNVADRCIQRCSMIPIEKLRLLDRGEARIGHKFAGDLKSRPEKPIGPGCRVYFCVCRLQYIGMWGGKSFCLWRFQGMPCCEPGHSGFCWERRPAMSWISCTDKHNEWFWKSVMERPRDICAGRCAQQ